MSQSHQNRKQNVLNRRSLIKGAAAGIIMATAGLVDSVSALDGNKDEAFAANWAAIWSSHDIDAILAMYTDNVFYEDVTFGAQLNGKDQLRQFAANIFAAVPNARFDAYPGAAIRGNVGHIEWTFSGTDVALVSPPTGKDFSVRGSSPIELHGGKISKQADYYDFATILRQIGKL